MVSFYVKLDCFNLSIPCLYNASLLLILPDDDGGGGERSWDDDATEQVKERRPVQQR